MNAIQIAKLKRALRPVKGDKGEPGQDGYTPVKGKDYYTSQEIKAIKAEITPVKGKDYIDAQDGKDGRDGKDGKDGKSIKGEPGKNGKDGKDGKSIRGPSGKDGKDGVNGKDGKDGKDGNTIQPQEIVDKLESLSGSNRLDASAIKNLDQKIKKSSLSISGFASGGSITETDPIYTADKSNIVFGGDDVSRLVNDAGYITGFTETDPVFTASEASNFATGDKNKLDGIEDNANNYVLETHDNTKHLVNYITAGDIPAIPGASDVNPQDHGIAAPGISDDYSRADHIHNSDNTDTTYTAGDGIAISEQNVISNTDKGSDVIVPTIASWKSHRVANVVFPEANEWYDIEWDLKINPECIGNIEFLNEGEEDEDKKIIVIGEGFNDIFKISGCIRPEFTGPGGQSVGVASRIVFSTDDGVTWNEARCLQSYNFDSRGADSKDTYFYIGTIRVTAKTWVKLQGQVSDVRMELRPWSGFDNGVASTITMFNIGTRNEA